MEGYRVCSIFVVHLFFVGAVFLFGGGRYKGARKKGLCATRGPGKRMFVGV